MLRYGIPYILDGVVGKLELVSVGVNELLLPLFLEVLDRAERRKGC